MDSATPHPRPASPPLASTVGLPVFRPSRPAKPGYQRAIEVALRSIHIASMGLLLGGIGMGGTEETLLGPIAATVTSGLLLLAACLRWGCFNFTQGAGYAFLLKLGFLGLGNVFDGARLQWYLAATLVTSVGSHMPSAWRHFSIPGRMLRWAGGAGTRPA